jgi:diacylglycerol O-acyltransferase
VQQLTGLDASFLYMETPKSFGHVNSLVVYERPDDPDFDPYQAFREQFESRMHLIDPYRRRLVTVPFSLDHPYWVNDPDFDLDFHLRHIAIPPPGQSEQLAAQVARIIGRPCDRSRPLWEIYILEGLENNDFAVLTKIHHSTIDGASGVEALLMLHDEDRDGDEIEPTTKTWAPDAIPSDAELLGRTFLNYARRPAKFARMNLRLMQQVAEATRNRGLAQAVGGLRNSLPPALGGRADRETERPQITAPPTPFNASITAHRRLALRSASLADIKAIKSATDATVNDVVMAICAGALRNYLIKHDALPEKPLRALVPVSIRTGEETDRWTNRVSGLLADLPTHIADPLERIRAASEAMAQGKGQFDMVPAEAMVDMAEFALPAITEQASRVAARLRIADRTNSPVNVVISNVPGPRKPLYMGGARMKHFYPVSTVADGVGLNITVQSYMDTLDFGLVACRELVPDLEDLVDMHIAELHVLLSAAGVDKG